MSPEAVFLGLLPVAEATVLAYFLLVNSFYGVQLAMATLETRRHLRATHLESRWRILGVESAPTITMIAPAYNEVATIVPSVRGLLALTYPRLEVVVVNDGSTDDTLALLERTFDLVPVHPAIDEPVATQPVRGLYRSRSHPNLVVVDKQNGRRADAMNAGLNVASGELVCAIDADTLIDADALMRMVRPFLRSPEIVAAGGTIRAVNGCRVSSSGTVLEPRAPRSLLAGIQAIEYLRAFLFGRLSFNRLGGNLIVSGAFGLFRREAVIGAGGYQHDAIGEDLELVMRLRRWAHETGRPARVDFVPDPVAWTEVPETLRSLGNQRERWHRGLAQALWRHRRVIGNRRYGAMGTFVVPCYLIVELAAPLVEGAGIVVLGVGLGLGLVNIPSAILIALVAYGYSLLLTAVTLVLGEIWYSRHARRRDRFVLFGWALLEPLGYRQLTVLWRLRGIVRFLRGRNDWGTMERRGFAEASAGEGQLTTS